MYSVHNRIPLMLRVIGLEDVRNENRCDVCECEIEQHEAYEVTMGKPESFHNTKGNKLTKITATAATAALWILSITLNFCSFTNVCILFFTSVSLPLNDWWCDAI